MARELLPASWETVPVRSNGNSYKHSYNCCSLQDFLPRGGKREGGGGIFRRGVQFS